MAKRTLSEKLLLKSGNRVLLVNAPINYKSILDPLPEGITFYQKTQEQFNAIHLFVQNKDSLRSELKKLMSIINENTVVWINYPKKTSKVSSDLHMNDTWKEVAEFNLSPVASVAINETWTAIRLKRNELIKKSQISNSAIKGNELGKYIDTEKRMIILPEFLVKSLSKDAISFFNTLSYTNKKEYLVWILSAKQEKTRIERILKSSEKLCAGRKNPSEK